MASLSVHRAGFCDYICCLNVIHVLILLFCPVYFIYMAMMMNLRLVSQHSQ
ncbi:hypothetical protein HU200_046568 [Digitaria exilis]|uniref:Uncharacterized protein n=1 Tax=Digitaria exilis TaxID=1010633 RepID=A0A835AYI2_9POAL|nr:hypothetical protein HU200_046568 [Digitaria exilis]